MNVEIFDLFKRSCKVCLIWFEKIIFVIEKLFFFQICKNFDNWFDWNDDFFFECTILLIRTFDLNVILINIIKFLQVNIIIILLIRLILICSAFKMFIFKRILHLRFFTIWNYLCNCFRADTVWDVSFKNTFNMTYVMHSCRTLSMSRTLIGTGILLMIKLSRIFF